MSAAPIFINIGNQIASGRLIYFVAIKVISNGGVQNTFTRRAQQSAGEFIEYGGVP